VKRAYVIEDGAAPAPATPAAEAQADPAQ